ncbi:class II fructose-bisphosphatase [Anaerolineales bacterium HSG24]|nr:class II fructose-bisphosphatase [Anaerolineales bacterium HSG24]
MEIKLPQNLGLDLVRVTEVAAVVAGRWIGLGNRDKADKAATEAMYEILNRLDIDGRIVVGEEGKLARHSVLDSAERVGTGKGPAVDIVVDAIDGRNMLAKGQEGAISVVGVAPRNSMWSPAPAVYMDKIVVDSMVAPALVEECLHAPAAWTLALVARAKKKEIRHLEVFVLDRPRHQDLVEEIRTAGARVLLAPEGDINGALLAASSKSNIDIMMGVGGVPEGVVSACAVKAMGGAMLGYLAPQSKDEKSAVEAAGLLEDHRILTCDSLISSNEIFFVATGITDGRLLSGIRYTGKKASTNSLVLRCSTGTQRIIQANHLIE